MIILYLNAVLLILVHFLVCFEAIITIKCGVHVRALMKYPVISWTSFTPVQVVLIHSRIGLADPELLSSVRRQAKEVLLEKGVELLLGAWTCSYCQVGVDGSSLGSVNPPLCVVGHKLLNLSALQLNVTQKNTVVTTDKGETLTTDLIICCTGLRINSAAYASGFCESDSLPHSTSPTSTPALVSSTRYQTCLFLMIHNIFIQDIINLQLFL